MKKSIIVIALVGMFLAYGFSESCIAAGTLPQSTEGQVKQQPKKTVKKATKQQDPNATTTTSKQNKSAKVKADKNGATTKIGNATKANADDAQAKPGKNGQNATAAPAGKTRYVSTLKRDYPAMYPGGEGAYYVYINKNRVYPAGPHLEGSVGVQVLLDGTGEVRLANITKSLSYEYDKEALRLIINMPKWLPALKNGKAVDTTLNLEVDF